jgi:nucleoside-diphosphate-sugar epimerase
VEDRSENRVFSYVRDIAGGIHAVLTAPSPSYDIYNISTGEQKSLEEIIAILRDLYPRLQIIDKPITGHPQIGNVMETQRLTSDVGFCPRYDLRSGLEEYLNWRRVNNFTE